MKLIKIEKGIPITDARKPKSKGGKWKDIVDKMEVGDSCLLNKKNSWALSCALRGYGRKNGFNGLRRKLSKSKFRVWKVALGVQPDPTPVVPNGEGIQQ